MAELSFGGVMMGSEQPETLGEFYVGVLGRQPDMKEGGWYGWQLGSCWFTVGAHSEVKGQAGEPQRLMLNFQTHEVQAEFDRVKALGAGVVKEPYELQGSWIATLADPDGNYFQFMSPWEGGADPEA